jgi:hypothetical protein
VANDALVDVDTVRYSVPHRFVRDTVEVQVLEAKVRIYAGTELVAEHCRSTEPHSKVVLPEHYDGLWRPREVPPDPGELPAPPSPLAAMGRSLDDYAAVAHGGCHE